MLKSLRLDRPLTFVDVETTGVDPRRDRVVEIALMWLAPGRQPRRLGLRLNPERPIPPAASAVHGIFDQHVAHCPTFAERAATIATFFDGADLAGCGIARFDLPFLITEYERAGWRFPLDGRKVIDALTLFHRLEPRDLAAAVRRYCGREHSAAHRAGADVASSVGVLDAMLGTHPDLPNGVEELHELLVDVDVGGWFRRDGDAVLLARGKHRDALLDEVAHRDPSYLTWLSRQILPDGRQLILQALNGNPS